MTVARKSILVVDDEPDIIDLIRYNLTQEGFTVRSARNGKEALEHTSPAPDLVILDIMMPVMDGFETCRRLKAEAATASIPVLFLTARTSEVDEVVGLELGADDYIQKPISPRTLVARVKAVLRRRGNTAVDSDSAHKILKTGNLEIDRSSYTVKVGKKEVFFPKKEFEVLALLAAHPGKVYSREALLNAVWGTDVVVIDRTVDVHIRKIREKLGHEAEMVETIKGVGYRFRI
jgi:two-component system, OmpR family, alkaline phosphatase synthesis response regulator PhoP